MTSPRTALTLRVVHWGDAMPDLLREAVLPAAERLAGELAATHVLVQRHWRQAPHLRISVVGVPAGAHEAAVDDVSDTIRAWWVGRAPLEPPDQAAYLQRSERLGAAELEPPPYLPLLAEGEVSTIPYAPNAALLGGEVGVRLKERTLDAWRAPLGLSLEELRDRPSERLALVLDLLVLLADSYPRGGILFGYRSYRSHLEEFLHQEDSDGRLRAGMQVAWERRGPAVRQRLDELLDVPPGADLSPAVAGSAHLTAWASAFASSWDDALPLARGHQLLEFPAEQWRDTVDTFGSDAADRYRLDEDRDYSDFHTSLRSWRDLPGRPDPDVFAVFTAYRWLQNFAYSFLPLLDVSPTERALVCSLVCEAVDERFETSWEHQHQDIVDRFGAP